MPDRRDFIIGAGLIGVAAGAQALVPRRAVKLLAPGKKLDAMMPHALPGFAAMDTGNVIAPAREGSLADRLYSQTTQRIYQTPDGDVVMMLIAYGGTQNDSLSLHRPESCYPAVGFSISNAADIAIDLPDGQLVPARRLSARLDQRAEQICYWARVGEYLPLNGSEQRTVRLRNALSGIVADGVLVRISTLTLDAARGDAINESFARELINAIGPDGRTALLGTKFAGAGGPAVRV